MISDRLPLRCVVLSAALCLPTLAWGASDTIKIAKCQDAQGHWHYGDSASDACGNNKVTVINDEGMRIQEIDAPLTAAQLRAKQQEEAKKEDAKEAADARRRKDEILLSSYTSEADIAHERDRRLADIDMQIQASQATLDALRATFARMQKQSKGDSPSLAATHKQIKQHEQALADLQKERDGIKTQFDKDAQRFQQLQTGGLTPAAAPTAAPRR